MGFHLAAGRAIKRMAPTASSVSIGSGSGRCGAGLIRRSWSGLFRRIRPARPRLDALFRASASVAGLDDIVVMGPAVEQRSDLPRPPQHPETTLPTSVEPISRDRSIIVTEARR